MKFILMDVEGTTTSIDFVHQELFPYSKEKLSWFVENHQNDCLEEKKQIEEELAQSLNLEQFTKQLRQWIEEDKKHTALKSIQGKIWKLGYELGEIKGHVYPDVAENFNRWQKSKVSLGIYSSGSVLAQKLLFKYSCAGDLTPYLCAHFDTAVGAKREASSYRNIAQQLQLPPSQILFLSDISQECHAAIEAGMRSAQLIRDEKTQADPKLQQYSDFSQIS